MPEGFLAYFTNRYPRLLTYVHEFKVVKDTGLYRESMFTTYHYESLTLVRVTRWFISFFVLYDSADSTPWQDDGNDNSESRIRMMMMTGYERDGDGNGLKTIAVVDVYLTSIFFFISFSNY